MDNVNRKYLEIEKGENMVGTIAFVVTVLIFCVTILLAMYLYCCAENGVKMFTDMGSYYEKQLELLQKRVKKLEDEIRALSVKENK